MFFCDCLSACGRKPAILPLIPKYSNVYVSKASLPEFPPTTAVAIPACLHELEYHELLHVCESTEIVITEEMAQVVEKGTRKKLKKKKESYDTCVSKAVCISSKHYFSSVPLTPSILLTTLMCVA